MTQQYERSLDFIKRNLHHVQGNRSFNSPGQLEIPAAAFEEILVNALVHRDYLISAPIRLLIYTDRVEIISPGHLPNHLNTEQIRFCLSNLRNPALASHAFHILPYRGMGSGILRAIEAWPHIEFRDERDANQFRVTLKRSQVQTTGVNEGENDDMSVKTSVKILAALRNDPNTTIPELADKIGLTTRSIESALNKL